MVFLDANVFLYAAGASDPYREPCRRVLRKVEEGSLPSNTSVEVVQELLYVLWRRGLAEKGIRLARHVIDLEREQYVGEGGRRGEQAQVLRHHADAAAQAHQR